MKQTNLCKHQSKGETISTRVVKLNIKKDKFDCQITKNKSILQKNSLKYKNEMANPYQTMTKGYAPQYQLLPCKPHIGRQNL